MNTTIKLEMHSRHKHSIRYDNKEKDSPTASIYVKRTWLEAEFGNDVPLTLTVTFQGKEG